MIQNIFGLPEAQFEKMVEASELSELYDLEPMFAQVAFELSGKLELPLAETFKYADSLRDFGGDYSGVDDNPEDPTYSLNPPEVNLREVAFDPFNQFVFFTCHLSVDTAFDLLDRSGLTEAELIRCDPAMLREFSCVEGINFYYFEKSYRYYMENREKYYALEVFCDEDFYNYLELIAVGIPMEEALEELIPVAAMDEDMCCDTDIPEIDPWQEDDPFEKMAEEEQAWHNFRIDAE